MSDYIKRLAGPYIGTGTGEKTFTFGFFTYAADEIYVGTSMSNDEATTIPFHSMTIRKPFQVAQLHC